MLSSEPLWGYRMMNMLKEKFGIKVEKGSEPKGCLCGEVLKGKIVPHQCPLFAKTCSPRTPIGACMVSSEGACAAYYKYERDI